MGERERMYQYPRPCDTLYMKAGTIDSRKVNISIPLLKNHFVGKACHLVFPAHASNWKK